MSTGEIRVPRELRQFMPSGAAETRLGHRNGANRQYRYGNLHIREYDGEFLVHMDRVDPRKDPLGHLAADAPEVLAGILCGALGAAAAFGISWRMGRRPAPAVLASSAAAAGYLGYAAAKKLKGMRGGPPVRG